MLLYTLLKFFHIMFSSIWFGASFLVSKDIRKTIEAGQPHLELLIGRVQSTERLGIPTGLLTLITGLGLIFMSGGFKSVPLQINLSLLLTIILFFLGGLIISPTWKKIVVIIKQNGDLSEAKKLSKNFTVLMGFEHLLRMIILILMVVRI
jgi:hypothetical protein